MEKDLAIKLLAAIDNFADPIAELSSITLEIDDENEKQRIRRVIGEVMGLLDGEIAYPIRQAHGIESD